MNKPKCSECTYCCDYRRYGNTRGHFHCSHPDNKYIISYFESHGILSMPGFIGFGKRFEDKPSIKFCPRWCPILKGGVSNESK